MPPDQELRAEPVDQIREKLNAALKGSIGQPELSHDQQMTFLRKFHDEYSGSVHMAWHIMQSAQYGRIWGCKVLDKIGGGAFASVWRVQDPVDGAVLALKVLREETLDDFAFMEAFRRGVNAMKILRERSVEGMVRFVRAYDIPASILMEYIDGETLDAAIRNKAIDSLSQALGIILRVGEIVHAAHQLRERVLHRDLKPANVMIRNLYQRGVELEVIVLDFDLSWYEGAMGRSIVSGFMPNYCAPEQINRKSSSRHTAVDVFGMGMLLYFVCTGKDPGLNAQNIVNFSTDIENGLSSRWGHIDNAIARYLAVIILGATRDVQAERTSLPGFLDRLRHVEQVLGGGLVPFPSDLALLEAGSHFDLDIWDRIERLEAGELEFRSRTSGASVLLAFADEGGEPVLAAELSYAESGQTKRSNVKKYMRTKTNKACSRLGKGNLFSVLTQSPDRGLVKVVVHTTKQPRPTLEWFREVAAGLSDAARILALEE